MNILPTSSTDAQTADQQTTKQQHVIQAQSTTAASTSPLSSSLPIDDSFSSSLLDHPLLPFILRAHDRLATTDKTDTTFIPPNTHTIWSSLRQLPDRVAGRPVSQSHSSSDRSLKAAADAASPQQDKTRKQGHPQSSTPGNADFDGSSLTGLLLLYLQSLEEKRLLILQVDRAARRVIRQIAHTTESLAAQYRRENPALFPESDSPVPLKSSSSRLLRKADAIVPKATQQDFKQQLEQTFKKRRKRGEYNHNNTTMATTNSPPSISSALTGSPASSSQPLVPNNNSPAPAPAPAPASLITASPNSAFRRLTK